MRPVCVVRHAKAAPASFIYRWRQPPSLNRCSGSAWLVLYPIPAERTRGVPPAPTAPRATSIVGRMVCFGLTSHSCAMNVRSIKRCRVAQALTFSGTVGPLRSHQAGGFAVEDPDLRLLVDRIEGSFDSVLGLPVDLLCDL